MTAETEKDLGKKKSRRMEEIPRFVPLLVCIARFGSSVNATIGNKLEKKYIYASIAYDDTQQENATLRQKNNSTRRRSKERDIGVHTDLV